MIKTGTNSEINERRLALNSEELPKMLGCGKTTAIKIGLEANARFKVGKRVLWNVEKIQNYLNRVSEPMDN